MTINATLTAIETFKGTVQEVAATYYDGDLLGAFSLGRRTRQGSPPSLVHVGLHSPSVANVLAGDYGSAGTS